MKPFRDGIMNGFRTARTVEHFAVVISSCRACHHGIRGTREGIGLRGDGD